MRYAAYGSNLHPLRLTRRTPSARLLGTDVLAGRELAWEKRGQDGSAKCTIRVAAGAQVHVAVYEVDHRERHLLDAAEGLGSGYEIQRVVLPTLGECLTYVADPAYLDPELLPFTWYRELVSVGARLHGFPKEYVRSVEAVRARSDPDPRRGAENTELLRAARAWRPQEREPRAP